MRFRSDQQFARVSQLIDGGDWACGYGQCGTLRHICLEIAQIIDDSELIDKAYVVAEDATHDLDAATRHWGELAQALRHAPVDRVVYARKDEVDIIW